MRPDKADPQAKQAAIDFAKGSITTTDQLIGEAIEEYHSTVFGDIIPTPPPQERKFKVFEDINYRGRPDLQKEFGMIPLKIHYESAFFNDKIRPADMDNPNKYEKPETRRIVDAARSSGPYSCIDIERWWSTSDDDLSSFAAPNYEHIAQIYDDALDPGDQFGFYSTIPIRSLNKIFEPKRAGWMMTNDRLLRLGTMVDMTFPSLYALVDDDSRWENYARANIWEAKRIAPGKPCYPFLWPVYHPNAERKAGQAIDRDFWRRQLHLCRDHADGVVIWTLSSTKNTPFDLIPDWWNETVEFIESLT